ncbi:DoxX family protein [Streptomyces sp. SID1328]|uniref:DoxX family protein n=1 Tax=Streptomyces sp. SID1328 TaxID=2690250 RepID=UPI00136B8028|nr:DoxX family protein [Streptomyces sp. SID1328]MYV43458.1 DoxX family protein [Streptomyces sp. SID1328]
MFTATVILSALLALGFAAAALPKVLAQPSAAADADRMGYSTTAFRAIGLLELAGAVGVVVGLWFWPLGVAAAGGLLLVCAGAVRAHLSMKDAPKALVPALVFAGVAAAVLITRLASS